MKLRILSVAHKIPAWVETACDDFTKRMPRELQVDIVNIKPEKRAAGNNTENIQRIEAKRILEVIDKDFTKNYIVACDERGQEVTTLQLADKLKSWQDLGRDVSIVIGGADGLHDTLKKRADWLWSMSKLTLPHAFVRIFIAEQLYRAHSVLNNHPYHRE